MILLFDQNISFRILRKINQSFPDALQVRSLGFDSTPDRNIYDYAKDNDLAIVTFDSDFRDLNTLLQGPPPKIVWLRTGNTTTKHLAELINNKKDIIDAFLHDEKHKDFGCLEIVSN